MNDEVEYWQPFTKAEQTSQWVIGLDGHFNQATQLEELPWQFDNGKLQTCLTANSFWIIYTFPAGGKLAIRTCFDPQMIRSARLQKKTDTTAVYQIDSALGEFTILIERSAAKPMILRYTTWLSPQQDFLVQALPRDVYVLDENADPTNTEGMLYVTQSGPTSGLAYLSITKPVEESILYFQNLSALNEYCQMTHTDPSGSVTAQWPEIGFALPKAEQPLKAGEDIILSDALIYLSEVIPTSEFEAADQFLEAIAAIYKRLPKPNTDYYDWPLAAKRTVKALAESPDCGRRIKNQFYVNAYVSATQKPPESMVQLAILVPLFEYQQWSGKPIPLVDQLLTNLPSFFDEKKAFSPAGCQANPLVKARQAKRKIITKSIPGICYIRS